MLATAALDGRVALYKLPVGRDLKSNDTPGAILNPVAVSPPGETVRSAHPMLVWGHGKSQGWLFCGVGRRIVSFAV